MVNVGALVGEVVSRNIDRRSRDKHVELWMKGF